MKISHSGYLRHLKSREIKKPSLILVVLIQDDLSMPRPNKDETFIFRNRYCTFHNLVPPLYESVL